MINFGLDSTAKGVINSIEQITKDIAEREDYAIAMAFTQTIATLLRENGVNLELTKYQSPIKQDENIISMQYGVCFSGVDFTEHDSKIIDEILNKKDNLCSLTTCRFNANRKCINKEKRKECVEVSRKVLCLEENK